MLNWGKIILILSIITGFGNPLFSAQNIRQNNRNISQPVKKKFYIKSFENSSRTEAAALYSSAIPRSIRTGLRMSNDAEYDGARKTRKQLISEGNEFLIEGRFLTRPNEISVEFMVIYLPTNSVVIFADAQGYNDRRIFDLIDRITIEITKAVSRDIEAIKKKPVLISIDKDGRISIKSLVGANLSRRNFSNVSLRNIDMRRVNFSFSQLEGVDFSGSNLSGAVLDFVNLRNANLLNTDLTGTRLRYSDLRGVQFDRAAVTDADFDGALLDNSGDYNIGVLTGSGGIAWFSSEGRIQNNFFIGIRMGYSRYSGDTITGNTLPVLFTITFNLLNKTAFYNPIVRPYFTFGVGYAFALDNHSGKGIIGLGVIGGEINLQKNFSLFAEAGANYTQKAILFTAGAGVKIYVPALKPAPKIPEILQVNEPEETAAVQMDDSSMKRYQFIGIKALAGISSFLERADDVITSESKVKPRISFGLGFRYMLFPKNKLGFIIDAEFNRLGAQRKNDIITARFDLDYININVFFAVKFSNFYAGIGMYAGIPIAQKSVISHPGSSTADLSDLFNKFDVGGVLTFGYAFHFSHFKFLLGLDFKMGFLNIVKQENLGLDLPSGYKANNWTVMLHLGFGV